MAASGKRKLAELSVDEFLASGFDSDADDELQEEDLNSREGGGHGKLVQNGKAPVKKKEGLKSKAAEKFRVQRHTGCS